MTAAVNRLEQKGLVTRVQDPADGRCYYVHLTGPGTKTIKEAYANHARNLEMVADVLTAEERQELSRLLKKVGRHAEKILLS
jgi:MarR family 2-MHQ and catechol resistance regulon transcriptional repressor